MPKGPLWTNKLLKDVLLYGPMQDFSQEHP